jgi:hypothetical protein
MTRSYLRSFALLAATATSASAFVIGNPSSSMATRPITTPLAAPLQATVMTPPTSHMTPKKSKGGKHKEGLFTPIVLLAKTVLGEERLNKLRADVISKHSDVIASFVDTSDSTFGRTVLRLTFEAADKNQNGLIEEEELAVVLGSLGFDWLKEKQLKGIFARADSDENGAISLQEWYEAAPKTLRTNLIKLAKKNGGELGFLS